MKLNVKRCAGRRGPCAEAKRRAAPKGAENMEQLFCSKAHRGHLANLSFFAFTATPKH